MITEMKQGFNMSKKDLDGTQRARQLRRCDVEESVRIVEFSIESERLLDAEEQRLRACKRSFLGRLL